MRAKIVVDRVSHAFDQKQVLREVSFEVAPHELLCVVGTSGCGKTTLLRVMAGLVEPLSGAVFLDGDEIVGPSSKIAMVFQHFGLFPWKSVRANIGYGMANRGLRDLARVEAMMRMVGLEDAADQYPRQLSGGMQQRVGLARALAVDPEVLLMDEPFGALDAITREQLQEELLGIWERDADVTGVFITHDIDEALLFGDRVVVLGPRPAHLYRDIQVPIPRPRTSPGVRSHHAYPGLRAEIWQALRPEGEESGGG
jgi:NitT/TauT family transport system ATP-binding protein